MRRDRVVVVGGGVSGLTTAYRLASSANGRGIDLTVLEAASRPGGKIRTGRLADFPIEEGADSFVVRKPWALDLCRDLGLGQELVAPAPGAAYVLVSGRLQRYPKAAAFGVPAGIEELARWPGLSRRGRLRALADLIRPARPPDGDEPLLELAARRLGPEAAAVLVGPLLAGVHAGDAARLSTRATFPELAAWERDHGSLIRGAKAALRAARRRVEAGGDDQPEPLFATVWTGLSRLPEVLRGAIGEERVRLGEPVGSLERHGERWVVRAGGEDLEGDVVVLATPAFESARLLSTVAPAAAEELAAIRYASTAVVLLSYGPGTLGALPAGTGFIAPPGAGTRAVTACTFVSHKWPRQEHQGREVVRCYVGRAGEEDRLELPDEELVRVVAADLAAATKLRAEPEEARVVRWPRSMPQYEVGHLERLARIDEGLSAAPGIFLTGSAYRGVGVADCVRQGGETARRVRAHLAGRDERGAGPAREVEQEARS